MIILHSLFLHPNYPYPLELRHCQVAGRLEIRMKTKVSEGDLTGEDLALSNEHGTIFVRNIQSLAGHVTIKNPRAALELVRLYSLPATFNFVSQREAYYVEPMRLSDAKKQMFGYYDRWFGDLQYFNGVNGIFDDKEFPRLKFPSVQVRRVGEAFEVTRPLLRYEVSGERVKLAERLWVQEFVTRSGNIVRVVKARKDFTGLPSLRGFESIRAGAGLRQWD